ncbi:MAG: DsbA family protein, partial [Sphingobium sp.]
MSDTPASFGAAIKNGKIQMMLGGTSFVAAAAVAAFFLQSAAPAAAVDTKDRAAIEAIVRDYILEHPEILPQAMEKLASKRMGAVIDQNRSVIETPYAG